MLHQHFSGAVFRHLPNKTAPVRRGQRAAHVNAADQRFQTSEPLRHAADRGGAVRLRRKLRFRIHEMSRIKHQARMFFIIQFMKEKVNVFRFHPVQPRPENIFKKHPHSVRDQIGAGTVDLCRRFQYLFIGIAEMPCPRLFRCAFLHVPDEVQRSFRKSRADIGPDVADPLIRCMSPVKAADLRFTGKYFSKPLRIASVKIHPVRPIIQMNAFRHPAEGPLCRFRSVNKRLHAIQADAFRHLPHHFFRISRHTVIAHQLYHMCIIPQKAVKQKFFSSSKFARLQIFSQYLDYTPRNKDTENFQAPFSAAAKSVLLFRRSAKTGTTGGGKALQKSPFSPSPRFLSAEFSCRCVIMRTKFLIKGESCQSHGHFLKSSERSPSLFPARSPACPARWTFSASRCSPS